MKNTINNIDKIGNNIKNEGIKKNLDKKEETKKKGKIIYKKNLSMIKKQKNM